MKIVVHGLWHLGSVTAACLARAGFRVIGLDPDAGTIERLDGGHPPLYEPGLADLVRSGLAKGILSFSTDPGVVADADLVWVAFDTPVDDEDRANPAFVERQIEDLFPYLREAAVVLVSAQLPVGTTRRLAEKCNANRGGRRVNFAYSPENLRLGNAIEVFSHPERIVIGTEDRAPISVLVQVLGGFSDHLVWMSIESAEMVKHALNAFLATSVTFINEIASIAEQVGAQAADIEEGLKSEARIGRKAYLKPGAAFAGGTLARDVVFLGALADHHSVKAPLLGSIIASNAAHRHWPLNRLVERFHGDISGRSVAIFGLAYKVGTDALRRSAAVELCKALAARSAHVRAFDPAVKTLPPELKSCIELCGTAAEALRDAEAAIIATDWPEFRALPPSAFVDGMRTPFVIDQNGFWPLYWKAKTTCITKHSVAADEKARGSFRHCHRCQPRARRRDC